MNKFKFFHGIIEKGITVSWTPEMSQDMSYYHDVDMERELTDLLSREMANQIDGMIIERLTNLDNYLYIRENRV